jgi:multimeric flavodoxin WrbA
MKALIVNCTLKRSPEFSNTGALIDKAVILLQQQQVKTEVIRLTDYNIKSGNSSDEGEGDQWPEILQKIKAAEILILGTPIWMGHLASTSQRVIERLDAIFHEEGHNRREDRSIFYLQ